MTDEERWRAAAHAMQTGVAAELSYDPPVAACTPKHLRVGVNAAMVDHGALVGLLVKKGIFTREEYLSAIADAMEAEVKRYETLLSERYGRKVTLK